MRLCACGGAMTVLGRWECTAFKDESFEPIGMPCELGLDRFHPGNSAGKEGSPDLDAFAVLLLGYGSGILTIGATHSARPVFNPHFRRSSDPVDSFVESCCSRSSRLHSPSLVGDAVAPAGSPSFFPPVPPLALVGRGFRMGPYPPSARNRLEAGRAPSARAGCERYTSRNKAHPDSGRSGQTWEIRSDG